MTNTAPGKNIRAGAHIRVVLFSPPDKFQTLVFSFHLAVDCKCKLAKPMSPPEPQIKPLTSVFSLQMCLWRGTSWIETTNPLCFRSWLQNETGEFSISAIDVEPC